ncbi:uncharacterized protein Thert_01752 [Thermoanaerobacterium thermosaccharolyticum]|uniref:Uncharacterized protein n=1 Tax=Thermoanaerobacterium thermosaccharolyticum TaxID=1517 RepID=A0A223HZ42_THETR|nr:hypothetical protein [Thermoanaerobacterium thermosaccharolyticum]AST57746.1 uncharacterized protein Thert_01752 [Thermoanaerobacterium thermosaccharolyticum]
MQQLRSNDDKDKYNLRQETKIESPSLVLNRDNIKLIDEIIDNNFSAKKLMLLFEELLMSKNKDLGNIGIKFDIPEQKLKMLYNLLNIN